MAALVILITLSQDRSLLGVYFIVRTYPGWLGNVEDIYKKMLIGIYHANHLHYCALLPSNQRRPSERTLPTREFRKKEVHLHSDLIYYIYRLRQSETLMREDWYFHLSSSVAAHQFMQSSCFSDVQSSNVQLIDLYILSWEYTQELKRFVQHSRKNAVRSVGLSIIILMPWSIFLLIIFTEKCYQFTCHA